MAEPDVARSAAPAVPLTRRASLNVAAFGLDFGVKTAVGLVITPLLVGRLGTALFGTWEMLDRLAGYVATVGGRPSEALRLLVANRQSVADSAAQRRAPGGARGGGRGVFMVARPDGRGLVRGEPPGPRRDAVAGEPRRLARGWRLDREAAARKRRAHPRHPPVPGRGDHLCPDRVRAARGGGRARVRRGRCDARAGGPDRRRPVWARRARPRRSHGLDVALRYRGWDDDSLVEPLLRRAVGRQGALRRCRRRSADRLHRGRAVRRRARARRADAGAQLARVGRRRPGESRPGARNRVQRRPLTPGPAGGGAPGG